MTNISVHRLLDDAFAGIAVTPDVQDLKEEIRANLLDRVAELTAQGVGADDAARRAVDELGDVRALVAEATADDGARSPAAPGPAVVDAAAAAARQRVPVRPRYVVGVIVASVVILLAFVPLIWILSLTAERAEAGWVPLALAAPYLAGLGVGWIVAASLRRETAAHYAMPWRRAAAYGCATALLAAGAAGGTVSAVLFARPSAAFQLGLPLVVAGGAWLAYLLATQTNRRKPWVLELEREHAQVGNRFEHDPVAAARFGIYTVVVWGVTAAVFLAVGFTAGWLWALTAVLLGFAAQMLLLARMLFGGEGRSAHRVRPVP
ncbi:permease prefix domain 1-containing protein [Promicromonospora citrea]|uniref:Uncharacterized protein n=1 Tax=Promicromonospora citrea TaxID=43677 RepID=A0A8H9GHM7_9MICO|nr:permease prefix domain 1-containing protein [Promicromonospora citrea]NNH51972.1 hypothetical protein [Promicromonospora citrea]GGM19659.1 hypothetical protein GCM10010102_14000 [Promicromonospora citrea]